MRNRKVLLAISGVAALVLGLASVAFACTVFKGSFFVKGNAPNSGTVKTVGLRQGMVQTVSDGVARATSVDGSIIVRTGNVRGNKLPRNEYLINYFNGRGYSDHKHWVKDCMGEDAGVNLGKVKVNRKGKIVGQPRTFNLPPSNANTGGEESAVCITDKLEAYGNMAPVTIL